MTPSTAKFPAILWSSSPCTNGNCYGALTVGIAAGAILGMPRPDGYAWGSGTFQGTRTFDSSAGTWTTPDATAGDVYDPASQKSYMWNGNNAVSYADVTGFDAIAQGPDAGSPLFFDASGMVNLLSDMPNSVLQRWAVGRFQHV